MLVHYLIGEEIFTQPPSKASKSCHCVPAMSNFTWNWEENVIIVRIFCWFSLSSWDRVIGFGDLKFWNKTFVTKMWHFFELLFQIKVRLPWTAASPVNKLQFRKKRSTPLKNINIQIWNFLNLALELQILRHLRLEKRGID